MKIILHTILILNRITHKSCSVICCWGGCFLDTGFRRRISFRVFFVWMLGFGIEVGVEVGVEFLTMGCFWEAILQMA